MAARSFGLAVPQERFNLLLLREGEAYLYCIRATFYPESFGGFSSSIARRQVGTLRVCSHSVFFVPSDPHAAIIRILYAELLNAITKWPVARKYKPAVRAKVINVFCSAYTEMKENNQPTHRHREEANSNHRFAIHDVDLSTTLTQLNEIVKINAMPERESRAALESFLADMTARVLVDPSWLEDMSEQMHPVTWHVQRIVPEGKVPGLLALTNHRLYFHSFYNDPSESQLHKFNLSSFIHVYRRRHMLRSTALEIFMPNYSSVMFAFPTAVERDSFHMVLMSQHRLTRLIRDNLQQLTLQWQQGETSNFDYLMQLNLYADRTFNDLRQYPVFPWVVADYTSPTLDLSSPSTFRDLSQPIGALNDERLKQFLERFEEMPPGDPDEGLPPPFIYGTHYSTPAFVVFYLIRLAPEFAMKLQNGSIDHADRLFQSVAATWDNCLNNMSDVKELIPEFYSLPGDFLINGSDLDLGTTQTGRRVDDVSLPPWASNSIEFVNKMREALESEYVSRHLHEWIDLIFGYKQRGPAAVEAHNLFYYLTYEGACDFEAITDPRQRESIEIQISEFGQCPSQLFTEPHPARRSHLSSLQVEISSLREQFQHMRSPMMTRSTTDADDVAFGAPDSLDDDDDSLGSHPTERIRAMHKRNQSRSSGDEKIMTANEMRAELADLRTAMAEILSSVEGAPEGVLTSSLALARRGSHDVADSLHARTIGTQTESSSLRDELRSDAPSPPALLRSAADASTIATPENGQSVYPTPASVLLRPDPLSPLAASGEASAQQLSSPPSVTQPMVAPTVVVREPSRTSVARASSTLSEAMSPPALLSDSPPVSASRDLPRYGSVVAGSAGELALASSTPQSAGASPSVRSERFALPTAEEPARASAAAVACSSIGVQVSLRSAPCNSVGVQCTLASQSHDGHLAPSMPRAASASSLASAASAEQPSLHPPPPPLPSGTQRPPNARHRRTASDATSQVGSTSARRASTDATAPTAPAAAASQPTSNDALVRHYIKTLREKEHELDAMRRAHEAEVAELRTKLQTASSRQLQTRAERLEATVTAYAHQVDRLNQKLALKTKEQRGFTDELETIKRSLRDTHASLSRKMKEQEVRMSAELRAEQEAHAKERQLLRRKVKDLQAQVEQFERHARVET